MAFSPSSAASPRSKLIWLLISGLILALVALLSYKQTLTVANDLIQDFTIAVQQHPLSNMVVIVAIDDDSINTFGRWPWRRNLHAELVNRISEQHPAAIGLDILLSEPDLQHTEDDQRLATAIMHSSVVTLPVIFSESGQTKYVQTPIALLSRQAAGLGHVHLNIDSDGVVRSTLMQQEIGNIRYPHFSLSLLETAGHLPQTISAPSATQLIAYAGKAGIFPRISYREVIEGNIPDNLFRDKLVLVGATASGIGDQYATPVSGDGQLMPGVEILANIVESHLSHRSLVAASPWQDMLLNLAFVSLALLGFMLLSPLAALLLSVSLLVGLLLITCGMSVFFGILLAPSAGCLGLMLIYPLWSWHRLDTATRFLTAEFESFKRIFPMLSTSQQPAAFTDFLDKRIHALHEASQQLQGMHRFISDSVNGLPDPTLVCDPGGIIRIANQAAAQYFGVNSADLLLQQPMIPLLQDIQDNQTSLPVVDNGTMQAGREVEAEARDAGQRDLLVKFTPCQDSHEQHIGWILSIIDVSRLWQAERDRDEAFRFIAHDIRAPLSSIISLVELHKLGPETSENRIEERWLDLIEQHADNALALTADFVQLSRAKSGHYQLQDAELTGLLHEVVDDAWVLAYSRDISITLDTTLTEAYARVDRPLFKRAIANLLSNAIKFSPDHSTILCSIHAEDDHWNISVQDSGIGIAPEAQSQLFQSFSRVHQQSHPHIEGIGLGLAFVQAVVIRHQGKVRVTSTPGQGSLFNILLPRYS